MDKTNAPLFPESQKCPSTNLRRVFFKKKRKNRNVICKESKNFKGMFFGGTHTKNVTQQTSVNHPLKKKKKVNTNVALVLLLFRPEGYPV